MGLGFLSLSQISKAKATALGGDVGEQRLVVGACTGWVGLGRCRAIFLTNSPMADWEYSNSPPTHHSINLTIRLKILMVSTQRVE